MCKYVIVKTVIVRQDVDDHFGVVGKGGYSRTRTRILLKYTFTFIKQLFFIPYIVFTAAFASRPKRRSCHSAYPFISSCAKDRLMYADYMPHAT